MISFVPTRVPAGSSSVQEWEYEDEPTGRQFEVRLLIGATSIEDATGKAPDEPGAARYFLAEFLPNGRLVKDGEKGKPDEYLDIPDKEWARAAKKPGSAWAALANAKRGHPGFFPILVGGGLGCNSIFYPSLDECARQAQNALDADYWVCSNEPTKSATLALRCTITLEAKALLAGMPGQGQISATILDIASRLSPHEEAEASEHCGGIRVEVIDPTREHPDCCRLMLLFAPSGRVNPKGGFVRGAWAEFADSLAHRTLPRYDGPEGVCCGGLPAYGQSFGPPRPSRPAGIGAVEVLHKMEGASNKVYAYAEIGGREVFVWGRFGSGTFQVMEAEDRYGKLSEKRDRGYEMISPNSVPDFWSRLQAAVAGLSSDAA